MDNDCREYDGFVLIFESRAIKLSSSQSHEAEGSNSGSIVTSSVLISCWVSSTLVEHWVRKPSSRSAEMSIMDCMCMTSKARRFSCSVSSLPSAIPRRASTIAGSSSKSQVPYYLTGIMSCRTGTPLSLVLQATKPLINIDNHLGRLSRS